MNRFGFQAERWFCAVQEMFSPMALSCPVTQPEAPRKAAPRKSGMN
ncbi:hypothetical protein [Methyloceanibacter sp.]|nr:hypothetical protein [Methyloceanibacter sp.]HML91466.1 hypothetical protein [Methyloceanibacter sp.]